MGSPVEILCSEFGQRLGQSSLQEIVACLGEPAAGLPNQYVLEKAFAAADLDLRYLTFEVSSGGLADALRGARALGLLGLQLEAPHQSTAVELIDKLTDVANYVGAVDLVTRDGDQLRGDHSVGKAVSQCLAQQKANLRSKFVVFGTGAAARSVVFESAMSGATEIVVVGRDRGRGRQLIDSLIQRFEGDEKPDVACHILEGSYELPEDANIIVRATSVGVAESDVSLPPSFRVCRPEAFVVDLEMADTMTPFLHAAEARGCRAIQGIDIWIQRAALAMKTWTGKDADRRVMREALEEFLMI